MGCLAKAATGSLEDGRVIDRDRLRGSYSMNVVFRFVCYVLRTLFYMTRSELNMKAVSTLKPMRGN